MGEWSRNPAKPWPRWPRVTEEALQAVKETLESGRWAITGDWTGSTTRERKFAQRFASTLGVAHCIPTANGSSALVVALEALEIGFGDEVIIPALTWLANATAVLRVNAVPVLADIQPSTLCIDPAAIRAAITPRTKAICVVHLYSSMAEIDAIRSIGREYGLPIIEDCAQAHGARWRNGEAAGSLGTIGVFSFQEGKVLSSGEGGAAVTGDGLLARKLEQLRADGRLYRTGPPGEGEMELYEVGEVQGVNFCMTEVAATLLLEGLQRLESENQTRASAAASLDASLAELPGICLVQCPEAQTARTYYHYVVRIDTARLGIPDVHGIARDLSRRLHLSVGVAYPPISASRLYKPWTKASLNINEVYSSAVRLDHSPTPAAVAAHRQCLTLQHRVLLGDEEDLADVVSAFRNLWHEEGWTSK